jgi:hypothetical protein
MWKKKLKRAVIGNAQHLRREYDLANERRRSMRP